MSEKLQDILRSTREKRRFSLLTVHQETRISVAYLEAMESGRWEVFPAEVYLTGFLRKYASYLGLNPDEMLALYRQERAPAQQQPAAPPSAARKAPEATPAAAQEEPEDGTLAKAAALMIVAAILVGVILYAVVKRPQSQEKKPEPLELKDKFAKSSLVQNEELTLGVRAVDNVWIRVVADDKLAFEGFLPTGAQRDYPAKDEIRIRIGNANSLQLTLNGRAINPRVGAKQDVNELTLTPRSLTDEALHHLGAEARPSAEPAAPAPAGHPHPAARPAGEKPREPAPQAPKTPAAPAR